MRLLLLIRVLLRRLTAKSARLSPLRSASSTERVARNSPAVPEKAQGRLKVRCKASGAAVLVPVGWGLLWSDVSAFTES